MRRFQTIFFFFDLNFNNIFIVRQGCRVPDEILKENSLEICPSTPITKSVSTPASLQTIVRIQNGSNMSLQHKVSISISKFQI